MTLSCFSLLTAVPMCILPAAEWAPRRPPEGHMRPLAVPRPRSPGSQVHRPLLRGPDFDHCNLFPWTPNPPDSGPSHRHRIHDDRVSSSCLPAA